MYTAGYISLAQIFYASIMYGRRYSDLCSPYKKNNEMVSFTKISSQDNDYVICRFGAVTLSRNAMPMGLLVIDSKTKRIVKNKLAIKLAKLYLIWEAVFIRPYIKVSRGTKTILKQQLRISKRMKRMITSTRYQTTEEEKKKKLIEIFKRLDNEILKYTALIEKSTSRNIHLIDLFWEISDNPTEEKIAGLLTLTQEIKGYINSEKEVIKEREKTWRELCEQFEKVYGFSISFEPEKAKARITAGALIDLVSSWFGSFKPRAIIIAASYEFSKYLFDVLAGAKSLERAYKKKLEILRNIQRYEEIWAMNESQITNLLRHTPIT